MNIFITAILILIAILCLVYLLRSKIVYLTSYLPQIIFPIFLIICLSSLFIPKIYLTLSDYSLRKVGVFDSMQELDQKINSLKPETIIENTKEESKKLIDSFVDLFSKDEETDNNDQEKNNLKEEENDMNQVEPGYFVLELYPKFIETLSIIYRTIAIVIGIAGMILAIYLSYSIEGIREYRKLKSRLKKLEKRMAIFESGNIDSSQNNKN